MVAPAWLPNMKYLLLLLLAAPAKAAPPLAQYQTMPGSTFTVRSFSDLPIFLSSQGFVNSSSATFSVNAPTGSVVNCEAIVVAASAPGTPQLTYNADSAANYNFYTFNDNSSTGNNAAQFIRMTQQETQTAHPAYIKWSQFQGPAGTTELPYTSTFSSRDASAGQMTVGTVGALWRGNSSASFASINSSSGTITGIVRCNYEKF